MALVLWVQLFTKEEPYIIVYTSIVHVSIVHLETMSFDIHHITITIAIMHYLLCGCGNTLIRQYTQEVYIGIF